MAFICIDVKENLRNAVIRQQSGVRQSQRVDFFASKKTVLQVWL
jgi:hypothetical protein